MAHIPTIEVRVSTPSGDGESYSEEFERIVAFLRDHPSDFIAERAKGVVEEAFELGNILLVELPSNGEFNIEGCAFIYEHLEASYIEIGTVSVPSLGSFGIQKLLIALTAGRYLLRDRERPKKVFATFNPSNRKQYHRLAEAFMTPWPDPPTELVEAKSHTVAAGAENPEFYQFDEERLAESCQHLVDIIDENHRPERENRFTRLKEQLVYKSIDHVLVRRQFDLVRQRANKP